MQVSERLEAILRTAGSIDEALVGYKKAVVEDLAIAIRRKESMLREEDERDAQLLALLPSPVSPVSEVDTALEPTLEKDLSLEVASTSFCKRDSSALFSEHENGDSSALDIDDEELMNEMEELLA